MVHVTEKPLLAVRDLETHYPITDGWLRRRVGTVRAVDGISFDVSPGETFGLVGESGCGKSTTAHSILRLVEPTGGEIQFDGENVGEYDRRELRDYRRRVQLLLQDPSSAFNPRMTVGQAVAEPLRIHGMTDGTRRRRIVEDALERIGLSAADADSYPHEFSGGEKQRIALARALVLNPDLLVADEPTSALDGRTKADVLRLMADLQDAFDVAILLISHDIDLVRRFCDRVAVMYLGSIVEQGPMADVVSTPQHPYTRALMASVPSLDPAHPADETAATTLTDDLPDATAVPSGCRFHTRCPAIIPPSDVDLDRSEWLGVTRLRLRLADDWSGTEAFVGSLDSTGATLDETVRSAFDLPASVSDPEVEAALAAAISALERDELDTAIDRLHDVAASVCERTAPTCSDEHTPHAVACHRYDPTMPGDPLPERVETR